MLIRAIEQCVFFLALSATLFAQTVHARLRELVAVAAEDGIVAICGNTLSVFSNRNIRLRDPKTHQWKMAEKRSGAVSLKIRDAEWQQTANALPVATASGFAFCDPLNQVDVHSNDRDLGSALPPGAKVKTIVNLSSDSMVAVYSVSTSTVRYDVRLGLLEHTRSGGYSLLESVLATDAGMFCGIQRGGNDLVFLFATEPAGSSDFSAVYVYSLAAQGRVQ